MELIQLAEDAYQLRAGSNVGLLVQNGQALVIDAGLDRDAARRIMKHLNGLGVTLAAILVTHAHADHFGGAADLKRRATAAHPEGRTVPVLAPAFEAAVVENPLFEPVYLFAGAQPTRELQGKFILAKPCPVDGLLAPGRQQVSGFELEIIAAPGHAHNQIMIGSPQGGVCYAGDAYFPPAVLDKYGIPFYVEIDQTLETLERLPKLPYRVFAQGHGEAYSDLQEIVSYNSQRLRALRAHVLEALDQPRLAADVLKQVADRLGVSLAQPAIYYLTRTTIHACLNSLREAGQVDMEVRDNRLLWRAL